MTTQPPKQRALEMLQAVGKSTLNHKCTDGYTLPIEISKTIVLQNLIWIVEGCKPELRGYYQEVQNEVVNFKL